MMVCGCHNVQLSKSLPLLHRNSTFYQFMAAIYSEIYPAFLLTSSNLQYSNF